MKKSVLDFLEYLKVIHVYLVMIVSVNVMPIRACFDQQFRLMLLLTMWWRRASKHIKLNILLKIHTHRKYNMARSLHLWWLLRWLLQGHHYVLMVMVIEIVTMNSRRIEVEKMWSWWWWRWRWWWWQWALRWTEVGGLWSSRWWWRRWWWCWQQKMTMNSEMNRGWENVVALGISSNNSEHALCCLHPCFQTTQRMIVQCALHVYV